MSGDVCIVGIGIHPFGRTDGVSGLDQGVNAVRSALADAGLKLERAGGRGVIASTRGCFIDGGPRHDDRSGGRGRQMDRHTR